MRPIITGIFCIFVCGFGYEEVNKVVGKVIDKDEAAYYRIFQDIPGFKSARFFFSGESVCVEMNTARDSFHETKYRTISMMSYIALGEYIEHFRRVVENDTFRRQFISTYVIDWPLVTKNEVERVTKIQKNRNTEQTCECVALGTTTSANMGTCIAQEKVGETECGDPIYTIRHDVFCRVTVIGSATSLLISSLLKPSVSGELLKKDILAFDHNNMPITLPEVDKEMKKGYGCSSFACGFGVGMLITGVTVAGVGFVRLFNTCWSSPEDEDILKISIVALGITEWIAIIRAFQKSGEERERKAAIRRIVSQRKKDKVIK